MAAETRRRRMSDESGLHMPQTREEQRTAMKDFPIQTKAASERKPGDKTEKEFKDIDRLTAKTVAMLAAAVRGREYLQRFLFRTRRGVKFVRPLDRHYGVVLAVHDLHPVHAGRKWPTVLA